MLPTSSNGTDLGINPYDEYLNIINKMVLDDISSDIAKDDQFFIYKMYLLADSKKDNSVFDQDLIYSKVPLQLTDFDEDCSDTRTSKSTPEKQYTNKFIFIDLQF